MLLCMLAASAVCVLAAPGQHGGPGWGLWPAACHWRGLPLPRGQALAKQLAAGGEWLAPGTWAPGWHTSHVMLLGGGLGGLCVHARGGAACRQLLWWWANSTWAPSCAEGEPLTDRSCCWPVGLLGCGGDCAATQHCCCCHCHMHLLTCMTVCCAYCPGLPSVHRPLPPAAPWRVPSSLCWTA